ncbi:hypothetical protein BA895_22290 [Humibacillus sp. DSM 29435]|nr:hypothetical protein BA895_22290 [Humibacillus sp. DSM 29435]
MHYPPKTHVYGVTSARTVKALQKVTRVGQIIQTRTVDSRFAAQLVKLETLDQARDHRCVIPRELIPSGRTEVWFESVGPIRLMVPRLASTKTTMPLISKPETRLYGLCSSAPTYTTPPLTG